MKQPLKIGDLLKKYNLSVLLLVFVIISSVLSPNFLTIGNLLESAFSRRRFPVLWRLV